jgi:hypothetical protein
MKPHVVVALCISVFAAGIGAAKLVGEARADARPSTATIYVPPEGLVFRGADGRSIARLSSDASGGVFELYNAQEQPAAKLRASTFTGTIDLAAPRTQKEQPPPTLGRKDLGF